MITATEPRCMDEGRYTTMQTCAILGIHRKNLARYVEGGGITPRIRKAEGRKVYRGVDIKKLWRASLC